MCRTSSFFENCRQRGRTRLPSTRRGGYVAGRGRATHEGGRAPGGSGACAAGADAIHRSATSCRATRRPTMSGTPKKLLMEKDGAIGWIIFNQPEKRNAVSQEMWQLMP